MAATTIRRRCRCGAEIEITTEYMLVSEQRAAIDQWAKEHAKEEEGHAL